jgi:YidC/Oxa1 family membrane protein insertase
MLDNLLAPLEWLVSWIMIGWHELFSLVLDPDSGATWSLSIIGLVLVVRTLLIPLFVKQIKSTRNMQLLQPQVREIQRKYANDRERQSQELMKLYKDTGTNPLSSCLPILAQAPVFFALFRVLNGIAEESPFAVGTTYGPRGAFANYPDLFESLSNATLFGAPLSASFASAPNVQTQIIAAVMVVLMTVTTFLTQRQLVFKNMPPSALEGQFAQTQKIMLYVLPLLFLFSGYAFPLGVVLYWLVSNLWTGAQQYYVIRRMPAPGSQAEEAYLRRQAAKAAKKGQPLPAGGDATTGTSGSAAAPRTGSTTSAPPGGAPAGGSPTPVSPPGRQQPKRQTRSQRKSRRK